MDKKMRRRIRLYLLDDMREKGLRAADVARIAKVEKGSLSKFLDPDGDLPLGLDVFVRLVRGMGLNANRMIHTPHPKERQIPDGQGASPPG